MSRKLEVTNLAVQDLSPKKNNLNFKSIGVNLDANYAPVADQLKLPGLSLTIDDIPLNINLDKSIRSWTTKKPM